MDTIVYNAKNDWDFVIVVTGDRMVRTGKSTIAQQVGEYIAKGLRTPWSIQNIFFDSQEMIDFAQKAPPNSVIVLDEARESLAANKHTKQIQQDILDYFAECGQLNHVFIIVLPDFFELKENIAVARSEFLINVYRTKDQVMRDMYKDGNPRPVTIFRRGKYEFFNRLGKQKLYDLAKVTRKKYYQLVPATLKGDFTKKYTVDEEAYKNKKSQALERFKEKKDKDTTKKNVFRDSIIRELKVKGLSTREIAETITKKYEYPISHNTVAIALRNSGIVT